MKPSKTKIERIVSRFLTSLDIKPKRNHRIDRYNVDFFIKPHHIIECFGDYWHCNPKLYNDNFFNSNTGLAACQKQKQDLERRRHLENMGFKVLWLWENEVIEYPKVVRMKIISFLKS